MPKGMFKNGINKGWFKKGQPSYKGMLGKKHSKETKLKMSLARKGKYIGVKSPNWKGGSIPSTIAGIHIWVAEEKGKAKNYDCEFCRKRKAFDWSNIDHKYRKVLDDYRALCRLCHTQWDIKYNNRNNKLLNQ